MQFAKAHACGNDFLIVESSELRGRNPAKVARHLCARTAGVGADGVEFFTTTGERAGRIRLHNADGSIAEISGNGTRCVAAFLAFTRGLRRGDTVSLMTDAGERLCCVEEAEGPRFLMRSGMGVPAVQAMSLRLQDGNEVAGAAVSTGNPHFVIFTDHPEFACRGRSWESVGQEICGHNDFPRGTNVEFVRMLAPGRMAIRIFERGVGPTSSSGTGTSASAAAAIVLGGAAEDLQVETPGGMQRVQWQGEGHELVLTGPAELIATGQVFLTECGRR